MKILLLSLLSFLSLNGYAQFVGWKPIPSQPISIPNIPDPYEITSRRDINSSVTHPSTPKVVNSDLINTDCFDFTREEVIKAKVKVINYSNGENILYLVGKKIEEDWMSLQNIRLLPIESLLLDAKTEQEKSNLLYLSDFFDFIAVDKNENIYGF